MTRKDDAWIRIPIKLLASEHLSTSAKVVYCYMISKDFYFKKSTKPYFESQESIACACNLSRKTVNECITALQKVKYLTVVQKTQTTLHYSVKDVFNVYSKEITDSSQV